MTRAEYMEELAQALKDYDEDFALDIIGDYRRHFDEAAVDGRSEESVCEELGSVEDFIRDIPDEFKKDSEENLKGEGGNGFSESRNMDEESAEEKYSSKKETDYSEDFEKLASDFGRLVNEAGRMAGKAGAAAGKAAIKAAKSADSAISRLSDVISDKINEAMTDKSADIFEIDEDEKADMDSMEKENTKDSESTNGMSNSSGIVPGQLLKADDFDEQDNMNPLIVCSYTGVTGLKMSVTESHVELTQGNTDAVTITMSRPLTKKERMYMSPVVTVEEGVLKFKQENKNKAFPFIYNIGNKPLIYYVNIPAQFEKVNISTVSGSINVQSEIVTESCKLSTVSGTIKTEYDIHADKIKFSTVSGSIKLSEHSYAKTQQFNTVSGSIKAVVAGESFEAETVSGSMKLSITAPSDGKISTVSGSIVINLLSDIGIDIKSSGMSGSMKLMTDKHVDWNNEDDKNTVHFGFSKSDRHAVFGDGGARIKTNSVSGSVKVYDFGKTE